MKNCSITIIFTILIFALLNLTSTVFSVGKIKIIIDNEPLVTEQEAFMENDRVMVPLRKSVEAMGYEVSWDPRRDEEYFSAAPSKYYREWRDVTDYGGVLFGTADCVPSYLHYDTDGLSIYKGI